MDFKVLVKHERSKSLQIKNCFPLCVIMRYSTCSILPKSWFYSYTMNTGIDIDFTQLFNITLTWGLFHDIVVMFEGHLSEYLKRLYCWSNRRWRFC